jgi:DNA-binding transcriptional ArsR family regulator
MSVADMGRARFAYSPLAEVAESLYMLVSGRIQEPHRAWFAAVRQRLSSVDLALLHAVVPGRPLMADFLFAGATDTATTIDQQLARVTAMAPDQLADEVAAVWSGEQMPPMAVELMASGSAGPVRLADALAKYWSVAIEPHWQAMRAILDDDVAFRAGQLTKGGVGAMLTGLHPQVSVSDEVLYIAKTVTSEKKDLSGQGLLLVPSVFVWPNVVVAVSPGGPPSVTYGARGVGRLGDSEAAKLADDHAQGALGALLGRSRAEILLALALPMSTTEVAVSLRQSPSSVSEHLSVLRRCGLVVSWRAGRRVLYRRTDLADSLVQTATTSLIASA